MVGDEGRFDARAPTTVNTMMGAVMAFVRYCHAHEWLDRIPKVSKLTVDDVMKGRPITDDEFNAMLDAVADIVGERPAPSWKFTLRILWETAFRVGEVMDFSWDDHRHIHPIWPKRPTQHPTLMIPSTQKNRKAQEIPTLPGLRDLLEQIPQQDRYGWIANPQPVDHHIRSRADWFRPTRADLATLSKTHTNSAIARACGVTETTIRNWLTAKSLDRPTQFTPSPSQLPPSNITALRQRATASTLTSHRRLTKERVGRVISQIGEQANIIVQYENPTTGRRKKHASAHDLRRACAQRLINASVSAETLKVLLRHHDFTTTEKFYGATRAAQSAAEEIYDRLDSEGSKAQFAAETEAIAQLSGEELKKLKALLNSI